MRGLVVREAACSRGGMAQHARVSIAFEVTAAWDPRTDTTRPIPAWTKDYDRGSPPVSWLDQHDVRHWGLLSAWVDGRQVGGAVLVRRTPGVDVLAGHPDRVVLWDLRVAPSFRGLGVGSALWAASERWARRRGAAELLVETQDTNPAAARFYAGRGCRLLEVNEDVYLDFPEELQLLFVKSLRPG